MTWCGTAKTLSEGDEIRPWGWSAALVHQLKQAGVDEKFLPSPDQLDSLRRLSHRQTAVEALAQCREEGLLGERLAGESVLCPAEAEGAEALPGAAADAD